MDEERKNYKPQLNRFKEGNRKIAEMLLKLGRLASPPEEIVARVKEKGRQKLLEMADEH